MTTYTHISAPTHFVDAAGIRFAFRRFGKQTGIPLVLLQHFTGNLDNWDPAVLDGFAKDREIIIFNNRGIASTDGVVPTTYAEMGAELLEHVWNACLGEVDVAVTSMPYLCYERE